jgi:hypothetical protein
MSIAKTVCRHEINFLISILAVYDDTLRHTHVCTCTCTLAKCITRNDSHAHTNGAHRDRGANGALSRWDCAAAAAPVTGRSHAASPDKLRHVESPRALPRRVTECWDFLPLLIYSIKLLCCWDSWDSGWEFSVQQARSTDCVTPGGRPRALPVKLFSFGRLGRAGGC